ncbi:MAG TPA: phosphoribosylanthranilate isomerase [Stellaceae bacterium]|nr:phosphoribosylanthranilate isomerase [Stellaceae bacterium]
MIVQIYEVGSPEEARALAALGVDHIGVLVGEGAFPRELPPARARAIFAAVPPPAKRVALSLSAEPAAILRIAEEARPDILHLGAAEEALPAEHVRLLKPRLPAALLMRSIGILDGSSIAVAKSYLGVADFLLLDTHFPGDPQIGARGRTHDWRLSRRIVEEVAVPAILAGGLGPGNVAAAIRLVGPAGVDSKSLTDRADGAAKDLDKVRAFLAAAKGLTSATA